MNIYAYFLPQFYPTPENDKYWGKGFTEWNNVRSAKPLLEDHRQPLEPTDLGYYDLSDINSLKDICDYSSDIGIDGFGYWHYWFGNGYRTLEKVPEMHLAEGGISQRYFFAWANGDWTKSWVGKDKTVIFKQTYSHESAIEHFNYIEQFIRDPRYIKINKKPVIQVNNIHADGVIGYIQKLEDEAVRKCGIGFHWLFPTVKSIKNNKVLKGLDYAISGYAPGDVTGSSITFRIKKYLQQYNIIRGPIQISQKKYISLFKEIINKNMGLHENYYPCVLSGWDNTPRCRNKGFIVKAELKSFLRAQFDVIEGFYKKNDGLDIILIKSLNEWAEGNVLEPFSCIDEIIYPGNEIIKFRESLGKRFVFENGDI